MMIEPLVWRRTKIFHRFPQLSGGRLCPVKVQSFFNICPAMEEPGLRVYVPPDSGSRSCGALCVRVFTVTSVYFS